MVCRDESISSVGVGRCGVKLYQIFAARRNNEIEVRWCVAFGKRKGERWNEG